MKKFNDFDNPRVAKLPAHLKQYIVDQHYERYSPVDHAVWRYVMRQNYNHLKDIAYYPYIPGLKKAGLSIEYIPNLREMNDALGKIGWGAVTVDGFIPPAAFMEFQACRVLVIAADIRTLAHIEYTPAPDIIHESAGHAPIIADDDYREYLSYFGSIGSKAIGSAQDFELYGAIKSLSILKEQPGTAETEIKKAEDLVNYLQQNMGEPSEMALLSRLHWWTVEYGLIGTLNDPKIYGAGLLSSIGESAGCMLPAVTKLWYNIDTINYPYDITRPQPHLFVTASFQNLIQVLNRFAGTMSFKVGGKMGLKRAAESKIVCTAVYSSGLQVTGLFTDKSSTDFIQTSGPSVLAFNNSQLAGHGKESHREGFSSPVGLLKGVSTPPEAFDDQQMQRAGIIEGNEVTLTFISGITVSGRVIKILKKEEKLQLVTFSGCTVKDRYGNIVFDPSWGIYDMAVGERIVSVFCGPADKEGFFEPDKQPQKQRGLNLSNNYSPALNQIYQQVRMIRERKGDKYALRDLWGQLQADYPNDWLCAMEILEVLDESQFELYVEIRKALELLAIENPGLKKLISDGLSLVPALAGNTTAYPLKA